MPSYYLRYFYAHDEVVREQLAGPSRAAEVAEIERRLLELYADPTLDEKPELLAQRGGAFYSEAAVQLAAALLGDGAASTHVVNLRNDGTLPFLPDDAVIEVPASVDRSGVRALPVDPLEPLYAGLVGHVTAYEDLALEAALRGGRRAGLRRAARAPARRPGRARRRPHRPAARPQQGAPAVGLTEPVIGAVLAIDAGNSKTDVCVVSADGALLGSARGGPFRSDRVGAVAALAAITPAVETAIAAAGPVADPPRRGLPGQRRPAGPARGDRDGDRRDGLGAVVRGGQRHLRAAPCRPRRVAWRGGDLRRRDQLHRRASGRDHRAVRRGRPHLRGLGRRRPPLAGGDVVGRPRRGRSRPGHRAAHRTPPALRARLDGRADRGGAHRHRCPRSGAWSSRPCCSTSPTPAIASPSTSYAARPRRSSRWPPPRSAVSASSRSRSTSCSAAACSPPATRACWTRSPAGSPRRRRRPSPASSRRHPSSAPRCSASTGSARRRPRRERLREEFGAPRDPGGL